jgi:hypothetical protein
MAYHRTTNAFTLIELMISILLGTLILYTAFAGFRTASQAITIANSLSLENSLLRAGYFQVQNDLDFWTSLDDPNNTSNQKLRPTGGTWSVSASNTIPGNPFTPMSMLNLANGVKNITLRGPTIQPAITAGSPTTYGEIKPRPPGYLFGPIPSYSDPWEADTFFDPTVSYSPSDPRTWVRVNMAEKDLAYNGPGWDTNPLDANYGKQDYWGTTPLPYGSFVPPVTFGRYGLFSNLLPNTSSQPVTFGSWQIGWNLNFIGQAYSLPNSGSNPPPPSPPQDIPYMVTYKTPNLIAHTWYPNQIQLFLTLFGFQAMCEYLPPNAIYNFYMSQPSGMTGLQYAGAPNYNYTPTGGHEPSNEWDWGTPCTAGGMSRQCTQPGWQTYSTSFGYFNPWAPPDPNGEPGIFPRHYMHFDSDYTAFSGGSGPNGGELGLQDLLAHTAFEQSMLPLEPTNWPTVMTAVGRLVKTGHFVSVAKIRRLNPLTGATVELSFLGLGTTLRGARMQRKDPTYGTGWAHWDDDPAVMTSAPGPNPGQGNEPNLDSPTPQTQP